MLDSPLTELAVCRQIISDQDALIQRLRVLLLESIRAHYHCDDSWYCCPFCNAADHHLETQTRKGPRAGQADVCNCGADTWNFRVRKLLLEAEK